MTDDTMGAHVSPGTRVEWSKHDVRYAGIVISQSEDPRDGGWYKVEEDRRPTDRKDDQPRRWLLSANDFEDAISPASLPAGSDPGRGRPEPFGFEVDCYAYEVWSVDLPAQPDEQGPYAIASGTHAEVITEMRRFIAEAQVALAALVRGEEYPK